ncbi:MAG: sigma-70 family RNA polymerase sigma factor [Actinomycetota bacterium]
MDGKAGERVSIEGEPDLPPSLPLTAVDPAEWTELLRRGRDIGALTTEEIVEVLRFVELTPEIIDSVRLAVEAHGIAVDQSFELDDSGELRRPNYIDSLRRERAGRVPAREDRRSSGHDASQDAVKLYLNEISRIPLIDAVQEKILGRRIAEGQAAQRRLDELGEEIGTSERQRLERLQRAGVRAREEMTQANLRLVVSIAKRYVRASMPLADAIQSGNIGLMKAVERFDYTRGFKFSTYATWWIKQAISRAVAEESRNIRVPTHTMENINRAMKVQRELLQRLQREPTLAEIARELGETPRKVQEYFSLAADTTSLDQPTRDDSDTTFADNLASPDSGDPSDGIAVTDLRDAVRAILRELPEREQEVMRMRFGLDGEEGATLEEVGQAFNITRERVRQIEVRTLFRLRHVATSRALHQYVDD